MRMVLLIFNNVTAHSEVLRLLTLLGNLGNVHRHTFDSQRAGYGEVVLCTTLSNRELQEQVGDAFPLAYTGVKTPEQEECHDCQVAA